MGPSHHSQKKTQTVTLASKALHELASGDPLPAQDIVVTSLPKLYMGLSASSGCPTDSRSLSATFYLWSLSSSCRAGATSHGDFVSQYEVTQGGMTSSLLTFVPSTADAGASAR